MNEFIVGKIGRINMKIIVDFIVNIQYTYPSQQRVVWKVSTIQTKRKVKCLQIGMSFETSENVSKKLLTSVERCDILQNVAEGETNSYSEEHW